MRYIRKGEEPASLANWKALANPDWTPTYDELRGKEKSDLHHALLHEQGYICCYCEMQISIENSHIEHFKPQKDYRLLELEYKNLLASCQRESKKSEPLHCGKKKDDWYDEILIVSPLKENCGDFFIYEGSGEIRATEEPDKQAAAKVTIDKLGLDIDKLRAMRSSAIAGIFPEDGEISDEEIQKWLEACDRPDANGQNLPFAGAIAYILKQYFIA